MIQEAFGELAAIFTTQEYRGVDIIMPTTQMQQIAERLYEEINSAMWCPDCNTVLVKSFIECHDGSGWMGGYLCACKPKGG